MRIQPIELKYPLVGEGSSSTSVSEEASADKSQQSFTPRHECNGTMLTESTVWGEVKESRPGKDSRIGGFSMLWFRVPDAVEGKESDEMRPRDGWGLYTRGACGNVLSIQDRRDRRYSCPKIRSSPG